MHIAGFRIYLIKIKYIYSLNCMLEYQMLQQLHAACINGQMTTLSHDPYSQMTQVGGGFVGSHDPCLYLGLHGNGLLHFSLKVII